MGNLFKRLFSSKKVNDAIIVVSGLPRSGTSMMMQMLAAGGMEVLSDGIREADTDNPKGYYEFERVKKIKEDSSWLEECRGKAVKMVSMLLYDLPADRPYKVIFMERKMEEILASQKKMLARLGREGGSKDDNEMAVEFEKHLNQIKDWLSRQNHIDVLYVSYNDIMDNNQESIAKIDRFLDIDLNTEKMMRIVDGSLYRQKK